MARMKAHDLRELAVEELKKRLSEEEENLANLRFQLATSQLESPVKVRTVRRDIARIKTVLAQKVIQAQVAAKTEVQTS
jgi:large subunit ribosomal protein L29